MTGVLPTGVPGLDTVLGGGLEPGMVIMLSGAPGTGKTILAQQICFAAATAERRAVYYTTMSEPHAKLVSHLSAFDFFEPVALGSRVEYLHLGDLLRAAESGSLEPMVTEVVRKTVEESPAVVVLDSVKALRDFAEERLLRLAFYDLVSRWHTPTRCWYWRVNTGPLRRKASWSSRSPTASCNWSTKLANRSTDAGCGY